VFQGRISLLPKEVCRRFRIFANLHKSKFVMQVRFTQAQLTDLFKTSIDIFFQKETAHILSGVAERSHCSRLAIYLEQLKPRLGIEGYYADTEYNRKQDGQIKTILDDEMEVVVINCDLIIHSRGEKAPDNLIAVEMKSHTVQLRKNLVIENV